MEVEDKKSFFQAIGEKFSYLFRDELNEPLTFWGFIQKWWKTAILGIFILLLVGLVGYFFPVVGYILTTGALIATGFKFFPQYRKQIILSVLWISFMALLYMFETVAAIILMILTIIAVIAFAFDRISRIWGIVAITAIICVIVWPFGATYLAPEGRSDDWSASYRDGTYFIAFVDEAGKKRIGEISQKELPLLRFNPDSLISLAEEGERKGLSLEGVRWRSWYIEDWMNVRILTFDVGVPKCAADAGGGFKVSRVYVYSPDDGEHLLETNCL